MRGFDDATILSPVSTVCTRNAWHNGPLFVCKILRKSRGGYFQKNWVGVCGMLPETLTSFQTKIFGYPYPISDLIKKFRPGSRGAQRVTSCYGTYTVGWNGLIAK